MKKFFLLTTLVITQVLGDIWLSQGMKVFGEVNYFSPDALSNLIYYLFTSPWILLGVSTLTFSMLIYLIAISRLDVSYVLPIHACSYPLNSLFAWLILQEQVSGIRWLATLTIGLGVFIVGWSDKKNSAIANSQTQKTALPPFMFVPPLNIYMPQIWLGVVLMALADSAGDILTAKGVKKAGEISARSLSKIWGWIGRILSNISIIGGIACYAISFLMFISLLSWADISLIRPSTAIGYVFSILGAHFVLHENISMGRLLGISVIGLGVTIISLS